MTVLDRSVPLPTPTGAAGAVFSTYRRPGTVVVTARGEVDAANTGRLTAEVAAALPSARRLVLDCGAVSFLAVEGFSTLQRINVLCAQAGVPWALVGSPAVDRVVRVCNPGGSLAAVSSARLSPGRCASRRPRGRSSAAV